MSDLKGTVARLAGEFASAVVAAMREASLEDIGGLGTIRVGVVASRGPSHPTRRSRRHRSAAAVGKTTDAVLALVSKHKDGLRAEHIRTELGVSKANLVRSLVAALAAGKLKKRGEKRATTYFTGEARSRPKKRRAPARRVKRSKKK
jgi:hypothetical protein